MNDLYNFTTKNGRQIHVARYILHDVPVPDTNQYPAEYRGRDVTFRYEPIDGGGVRIFDSAKGGNELIGQMKKFAMEIRPQTPL